MERRFLVGRRPVFDHALDVVGYKLMAASPGRPDGAPVIDVAGRGGVASDPGRSFGDKLLFVPAGPADLAGDGIRAFPPGRTTARSSAWPLSSSSTSASPISS